MTKIGNTGTVEKLDTLKKNPATNPLSQNDTQFFTYKTAAPADSIVTKQLWSDDTKSLLFNTVQAMGIKPYSGFSLLKDNNIAIAKSQTHLVDLMRYYEGDRTYYYEPATTSYNDNGGTATNGFGNLSGKSVTQEKAYKDFCKNLTNFSNEVKNLLNKKIGKNTYENLPNSIKEGLIDLNFNKGLGKISNNTELMNAIKTKDYSCVVKNLQYLYLGKDTQKTEKDPGLYRRSLSRMILAARDLSGKELNETKTVIDNFYKEAKSYFQTKKISTSELDKIYEQFTKGTISSKPVSAESYKLTIDETHKGKGLLAVAKSMYNSLDSTNVTFENFYKELQRINKNPQSIKIGDELKIPYIKNIKADTTSIQKPVETAIKTDTIQTAKADTTKAAKTQKEEKTEEKGLWSKIGERIKNFFKSIGRFFSNWFSRSKKENESKTEEEWKEQTPFQKMLDEGAEIKQDGDLYIVTQEYSIKKGDTLWNLARHYGTSEEIICNDNRIPDKNKIREGQKININKLGYKIQEGDNLYKIAQKFGLSVEILKNINNIEDENKINKDEMIEIPGYIYNVEPKDSLSKISRLVGVSIESLKKINGLSSDTIYPGQQIKVIYNNGFYAIPEERRSIEVDKATNTVVETIDMGKKEVGDRKYIQKARMINGKVVATREVFQLDENERKERKLSGKTIIVNAGHGYMQGGIDRGTAGRDGLESEWLINYDNAMRLVERLREQGAKVIFLQGREKGVPLISNEINKAENKADMFISIHVNSSPANEVKDRMEIYYHRNFSSKLAETFEEEMDKFTGKEEYASRKASGHQVLKTAGNKNMPGLLWEVAFMNSKEGRKRLASNETMNQYSDVLCNSIIKYFDKQKKKK